MFNGVADVYDRVRPTYPDEMFDALVAIADVDRQSSILEIGCGTGQATQALAAIGCSVTAVEPGAVLADLARRRVETFSNVEINTARFRTQLNDRVPRHYLGVLRAGPRRVDAGGSDSAVVPNRVT